MAQGCRLLCWLAGLLELKSPFHIHTRPVHSIFQVGNPANPTRPKHLIKYKCRCRRTGGAAFRFRTQAGISIDTDHFTHPLYQPIHPYPYQSMASNAAAVPFWRAAGMTYITYSNLCANLVRNCLKEPHRSEALNREKVHFAATKWVDGKPQKPTIRSDTPED